MPTIDNLGERITVDYLKALDDLQAIRPLLRISPAIYVPSQPVVHSLQPWASFEPPPNYEAGLKKIFLHECIIPQLAELDSDEERKKKFETITCDDEEESEEKETIQRLLALIKQLNDTLRLVAEQTVQYATGPLEISTGSHEDEAKYQSLEENRRIGRSYVRLGKFRSALAYLEAVVSADPKNVEDLRTLAFVYLHIYRPEEALSCLEKCLELDPTDPLTQLNVAKALFDLNRIPEGIDAALLLRNHADLYIAQNAAQLLEQYLVAPPRATSI